MRVVLPSEVQARRWTAAMFWFLKFVYVVAASALCVGIASFAPTGRQPIGPFVPSGATFFAHVPDGAALHQAFLSSATLGELLDDADTADLVGALPFVPEKSEAAHTLRDTLDAAFATLDEKPWPLSSDWLVQPQASGTNRLAALYPFFGDECAVALVPKVNSGSSPVPKKLSLKDGALIFTRVHGSHGHLTRMALAFFHGNKNIEVFDLGGGLIAIGLHGARPALETHAPPMVVSAASEEITETPLLQISFSPAASAPPRPKDTPIDLTDAFMARLFEDNVPESVLQAMQSPPTVVEMLNCSAPPVLARVSFFAAPDGKFIARGRIDGDVPPLPGAAAGSDTSQHKEHKFGEFSEPDVMGQIVLPVDFRPAFLRYVGDAMKKKPRMWTFRLGVLARDRVDLEQDFWPALGHVTALQIHDKGTEQGIVKAWLPFNPAHPESITAAGSLARARWDYLFENGGKIIDKPPYVVHYQHEKAHQYVLATGKNIAPAWSIGAQGLRLISDAGAGVFAEGGPKEADFPPAPKALDRYCIRLDGQRLAETVRAFMTYYFDEAADDLGPQKFILEHKNYERDIRLAQKWTSLLGHFELEAIPDAGGAEIKLAWQPASMSSAANVDQSKTTDVPAPKPSTKKDDDDAPPPPPTPK